MNAFKANLLNAIVLIAMGIWGVLDAYNSSGPDMSKTAFIPVVAGIILLICSPGIAKGNRTVAHVAVVLTLLILISLIVRPLLTATGMAQVRVIIEIISCIIAMIFFIKSFRDARKNRIAGS